jgi:nucleotide-binding universal stress UspA family protein
MRSIVVATDFSTRSDRAIRRAILLAKATTAELTLVHGVDDDQPPHLIDIETAEAERLLASQTGALREIDAIDASYRVALGDPFTSIASVAKEWGADLLIVGPHRRQVLKDVFVGTTAERIIRTSLVPVLMANAVPASPYRHILVAVDMSENSAAAVRLAAQMDWGEKPALSVFHAYDAPERAMRGSFALSESDIQHHLAEANARARAELSTFLRRLKVRPVRQIVEMINTEPATMVREAAREAGADLIVIGRQGRSGLSKLMLGSVAESVLRSSDVDVLAVPGAQT